MRSIAQAQPWLVVTDEGRRPWHRMFRARELLDGRRVAYWWGQYREIGDTTRGSHQRLVRLGGEIVRKGILERHSRLFDIETKVSDAALALSGYNWHCKGISGVSTHAGLCNQFAYVGTAFLPALPDCWRPDAVWPGWKHLAHGEKECARVWKQLEGSSDEELLAILEGKETVP